MVSQWKLRQQHDQNFPNGGKAIVEQILASEERNKSKTAGLLESVWDPSRKVNHLSKVTRIGKPVLTMDIKVSKDKNISRSREPHLLDETELKTKKVKVKKVIDRGKRSKTLREVKRVKNISKNLQSFQKISLMQKEVLLSHKL